MTHSLTKQALTKDQARSLYRAVRSHIGEDYAEKAAAALVKRFTKAITVQPGMVVAGYMPVRGEMNVLPLLHALDACDISLALPVVSAPAMPLLFRAWQPNAQLQTNRYNIQEPEDSAPVVIPDIILVPLLACDREGGRIGYGKGFYDVTLAHLRQAEKKPLAVGVGYHVQLADTRLPCDAHDQRLDRIVTEKAVIL